MPVSGNEISSLDFNNLIGGPLNAIVQAQAKSAITTANFIREVGFDESGKVKNVDFKYNKRNEDGADTEFRLTVPFITMLPIPYLTIERASLEFNARINSVNTQSVEKTIGVETEASASGGFWFASVAMTTNYSYQAKTVTTERAERTYEMHVLVEAGAAEVPSGTDRLLTLLENALKENKGPRVYKTRTLGDQGAPTVYAIEGISDLAAEDAISFTYGGQLYKGAYNVVNPGDNETYGLTIATPAEGVELAVGTALEFKKDEPGGTSDP